ncbi:MAG: hypothetical protein PHW95_03795 [Patescibacteria group bacterium]|nr:hypothetical protein [Patescibacteria group bacterium]
MITQSGPVKAHHQEGNPANTTNGNPTNLARGRANPNAKENGGNDVNLTNANAALANW